MAVLLVLVLMGIPFVGMTLMTASLLRGTLRGIVIGVAALTGIYLLGGFQAALVASAGSLAMTSSLRGGMDLTGSTAAGAAAASLAVVFGTLAMPETSILSSDSLDALMQIYRMAGLTPSEMGAILDAFLYLMPGLLVLWAAAGTMVSGAATKVLLSRREGVTAPPSGQLRLGLVPAWLLIASLAVNVLGEGAPEVILQGGMNCALVLLLPYAAVGVAVARAAVKGIPQLLLPVLLLLILMTPVALGAVVLTGILDTWFDFRERIARYRERKSAS